MTMNQITMLDLKAKLDNLKSDELILDVRTQEEYQAGHVPGSKNIPYDQVAAHADELKKYNRIYVHCQAGVRAGKAIDVLSKLGLTNLVCVAESGMGDWVKARFPVEAK